MRRNDSLGKTLMLGKTEGGGRRGQQNMRWLDASPTWWTWIWASSRSWWWTGKPGVLQSVGSQRVRKDWATELKWKGPISNFKFSVFKHSSHPVFTFPFLFPSISWVQCPLFPCLWSFFPSPSSSWPFLLVLCFSHLLFDLFSVCVLQQLVSFMNFKRNVESQNHQRPLNI